MFIEDEVDIIYDDKCPNSPLCMFIKDGVDIFYDDKHIILAQQLHDEKVLVWERGQWFIAPSRSPPIWGRWFIDGTKRPLPHGEGWDGAKNRL